MATVEVSIDIDAPPSRVWDVIEDIGTHTTWMRDALAIRFTSAQTRGTGTTFDCDTKIGPFRLTDRMEVTDWRAGETMAIRHTAAVTGEGRFLLFDLGDRRTRFVWREQLRFPRRQGGRLAEIVAGPVLRRIWKGNLDRLRDLVERG